MAYRIAVLAAWMLCWPLAGSATDAPAAAGPVEGLPEILVEAPEPRYAAATRRDRIGRIWAPVFINGKGPFRLVLDTGADGVAVIPAVANTLGIPILPENSIMLRGATGSAVVPAIAVDAVEVGDLEFPATRLPIISDAFGGDDGVLGNYGFADRRILIDFGRDFVSISRSRGQRAPHDFRRIPLRLLHERLLSIDVMIGDTPVKAIIDTGAQQTVGNPALLRALSRVHLDRAKEQGIIGVTLEVANGQSIPSPPVVIGGIQIVGMHVTFGPMYIFDYWHMTREPALLIGMDVLGSLDTLIIDYKLRELQIRPRLPGVVYR